jgi:hypothetical protein
MNALQQIAALLILAFSWTANAAGADARIVKVLPHFLDAAGRISLHPSLFERDGYQAHLKTHPELCSGMRFDVQWKAHKIQNGRLKLEVRGAKTPARQIQSFERELPGGGMFSRWTGVTVSGEEFKRMGSVIAWRLTIWDGDRQLTEEKSFLW